MGFFDSLFGGAKTTQTTNQRSTSEQTQQRNPWELTTPGLTSVINATNALPNLGQVSPMQQQALDMMYQQAMGGNPFTNQITNVANGLLSGGPDYSGRVTGAFDTLNNYLTPTAQGDFLDPNKNPFFGQTTNAVTDAAMKQINALYAGSGRDPSGAGSFGQNAGLGISQALAPIYKDVWNTERDRQLGAAQGLFTGANQTTGLLSDLSQKSFNNQYQGINAAQAALTAAGAPAQSILDIANQYQQLPQQSIAFNAGILGPFSQAFGTQTGTNVTTGTSTTEQQKQEDPWKAILGAAISLGSAYLGGPMAGAAAGSAMGMGQGGGGQGAIMPVPWAPSGNWFNN